MDYEWPRLFRSASDVMEEELKDMPKALRILANEINAPDHIPAMCLRDAATIIESLIMQRDRDRREAEEFRDDMRIHLTEGPGTFSWENAGGES